jgi:hypothetical protein
MPLLATYADIDALRFELPEECKLACNHVGPVDADIAHWTKKLDIQVARVPAVQWLKESGGWTREQLEQATDEELAQRILWLSLDY